MADEVPQTPSPTYIKRGGGTILLHAGYQYSLKEKYKNETVAWECVHRKKTKCCGKITLKVSNYKSFPLISRLFYCILAVSFSARKTGPMTD